MKIAVLSDTHANLHALQAVLADIEAWHPDAVIAAGDMVNRGPRPVEVQRIVAEKQASAGWLLVRGNHEDYVISQAQSPSPPPSPLADIHRSSRWTYHQLGGDIAPLQAMPFQQSLFDSRGAEVRIVHASMRGNRDGIYPQSKDHTLQKQIGDPPVVFCAGHTHRPFVRQLNGTLVVNAGSAGLPFDGDWRASYARLTWHAKSWQGEIVRVPYDHAAALADFTATGFIRQGGPLAELMLIELRHACSQLYQWTVDYYDGVLNGQFTMRWSVDDYLSRQGFRD